MRHTLLAWVENRPGVLSRVAGMFRRRALNIESLTVGVSERPDLSRMTVVVETDRLDASLVEANLLKLVDVVDVRDVTHAPTVCRDMALIKVRCSGAARSEVVQLADIFRARIVDVDHHSLIVEIASDVDKVDRLVELLRPHGVLELMRTGCIAMERGSARADQAASLDAVTEAASDAA